MFTVIHENFKCEDCGDDKFTIKDNFEWDKGDITLFCANKDCGASYTFRPVMKQSMSSHPTKRCSCGLGLLSREDSYCNYCGKKNTYFKSWRKANVKVVKKKSKVKASKKFKKNK